MSLIPFIWDYWDTVPPSARPSRLLDQQFGVALEPEDLLRPTADARMWLRCPAGYVRGWQSQAQRQDAGSTVRVDGDGFRATLDVQQFKPEDIAVKVSGGDTVTVEGRHEERQDEHGSVSRQFVRKYALPKGCDGNKVEARLSSDGVLSVTAPNVEEMEVEHRGVPIVQTGQPARQAEKAEDGPKAKL